MKTLFSTGILRVLFAALVATTGVLTTACKEEVEVTDPNQDFSAIDEEIIKKYLADNAITTAQRQPSGLYYVPVTSNPAATQATAGKKVAVLYTGQFLDGRVFDASSRNGNQPYEFTLPGNVIKGWNEGIPLMRKGEKGILLIPSALAYGELGRSPIPPNTVLRFEVELVNVQ
ncbi:FKBP-type peptidyl-prolyl cis-trans isomerase [Hymenobacter sp.]|uniref:FKBP-type peptidyl-prolyl cis-trans isomerase n=1 Tax=Hymenobacter sp. TaxID=1898978 RepID=UPI00286B33B7|nr:FKBP-type peptidyl-prolyl cis-trans isomerase [Hymenobacter sp.]